jgi:hydrogenase maturation protease
VTTQPSSAMPVLILGLGNILFQDEGLGVRAVEHIQQMRALPENVRLLDGGTLGLDLLAYFTAGSRLIILDAIRSQREPGSLLRLEGEEIPAALAQKMSMHQLGLQDLMAASILRGTMPEKVVLWGMVPAQIELGTELSPRCAAALPRLVEAALGELAGWGIATRVK